MNEEKKDANIKQSIFLKSSGHFCRLSIILKSFQKSMLLNPIKFRKQGFEVVMKIARYVLELLCMTGGTAYGKKKEPESNCKEDQKNGNYTDSEQEVQRYGVPDAVFGS